MGLSHSNTRSSSVLNEAVASSSSTSFTPSRASGSSVTIVQILEFIGNQSKASEKPDDRYKKYMHKAHMSAYKFNSRSQRKQTLSGRRRIGAEYDRVAGLAKACFQVLLEEEKQRKCKSHGHPIDQDTLEKLGNVQADWMAAYRLAECWGYPNPNNSPELQHHPWLA